MYKKKVQEFTNITCLKKNRGRGKMYPFCLLNIESYEQMTHLKIMNKNLNESNYKIIGQ